MKGILSAFAWHTDLLDTLLLMLSVCEDAQKYERKDTTQEKQESPEEQKKKQGILKLAQAAKQVFDQELVCLSMATLCKFEQV